MGSAAQSESARRRGASAVFAMCSFVAVLTTSACAGNSFAVPTSSKVVAAPTAVFDVHAPREVRAVRHGSLVCFYAGDGAGDRLVFPEGYSASRDLELRDSNGNVVATPEFAVGIAFTGTRVAAPVQCGASGRVRGVVRIEGLTG
jgi:hypothetical protein